MGAIFIMNWLDIIHINVVKKHIYIYKYIHVTIINHGYFLYNTKYGFQRVRIGLNEGKKDGYNENMQWLFDYCFLDSSCSQIKQVNVIKLQTKTKIIA